MKNIILHIILWYLKKQYNGSPLQSAAGDFEEEYARLREESNVLKANFWLIGQLLKALPSILSLSIHRNMSMLKNYFKVAFRNLNKSRTFSFINISGLALGIASFILIALYIQDELSYDKHYEHGDNMYRVIMRAEINGGITDMAITPGQWAPFFARELPEVSDFLRLVPGGAPIVKYEGKKFYENDLFYADPSVFDFFDLTLKFGDKKSALTEPNAMIITEAVAEKYFGNENPMGKVFTFDETNFFTVTGVVQETGKNSHFSFNFIASFASLYNLKDFNGNVRDWYGPDSWGAYNYYTYLMIDGIIDHAAIEAKFADVITRNSGRRSNNSAHLQHVSDIHLQSNIAADFTVPGEMKYIYIFSATALLIILIASINFMSLSTARSIKRSKEVGMRKVVGAGRNQLIVQFLNESIVMSLMAMIIALVLVVFAMPWFNDLTGKNIALEGLYNLQDAGLLLGFTFLLGVLSGLYPSLFLSGFKPLDIFKDKISPANSAAFLRKSMVVLQFSISVIILSSMVVVGKQLDFFRNKRLGFSKDQVMSIVVNSGIIRNKYSVLKEELLKIPGVDFVAASTSIPGEGGRIATFRIVNNPEATGLVWPINEVDHDFIATYSIEMLEGRNFSNEFSTDANEAVIINERAMKKLEWDTALGKEVIVEGNKRAKIVGVMKDFHFKSLHKDIEPLVLHVSSNRIRKVSLKLNTQEITSVIRNIEDIWNRAVPEIPFDYSFVDESYENLYRSEQQLEKIFSVFSAFAIIIACMGLFGLASFTAEQRSKEIGIRKVLGATTPKLSIRLVNEFFVLVVIAIIFAFPVTYSLMNQWLAEFAYRIDLGIMPFLFSGFAVLIISLFTVGFQALKTASLSPIHSLKYE